MTSLRNASLADCLPRNLTRSPDNQAVIYALDEMFGGLWTAMDKLRQTVDLRQASHAALNHLAVENQVPNWSESYSLDRKRALLLAAIPYWCAAGTVAATEEIMEKIFTSAQLVEWFEYGDTHHYFKVETTDPSVTAEDHAAFIAALDNVKRLSAWLRAVVLVLSADPATVYLGVAPYDYTAHTMRVEGV